MPMSGLLQSAWHALLTDPSAMAVPGVAAALGLGVTLAHRRWHVPPREAATMLYAGASLLAFVATERRVSVGWHGLALDPELRAQAIAVSVSGLFADVVFCGAIGCLVATVLTVYAAGKGPTSSHEGWDHVRIVCLIGAVGVLLAPWLADGQPGWRVPSGVDLALEAAGRSIILLLLLARAARTPCDWLAPAFVGLAMVSTVTPLGALVGSFHDHTPVPVALEACMRGRVLTMVALWAVPGLLVREGQWRLATLAGAAAVLLWTSGDPLRAYTALAVSQEQRNR